MGQGLLFEVEKPKVSQVDLTRPKGYAGLAAFHKYWGKKPVEYLSYLIENLTLKEEVVLDPFVGFGLIGKEAVERNRRFIGIDINPIATELSKLLVRPPSRREFVEVIARMEKDVKPEIENSYRLANGDTATHYLWEEEVLTSVWRICSKLKSRVEFEPTPHDNRLHKKFEDYNSKHIRPLKFFSNSRINAFPSMTIKDLFTGRALRNIDILLEFINGQPDTMKNALLLTLTAASGQMSKMVFAVRRRGKNNGKIKKGISVGSWVIGYWRPRLHFEISVWNCFHNRARRLIKALKDVDEKNDPILSSDCLEVIKGKAQVSLINNDARLVLQDLPSESVSLILTDPPHSDRMPYLELSELWNAIIRKKPRFDREIVVSNARERKKGKDVYNRDMEAFFSDALRVLYNGGILAIVFNAYDSGSWEFLKSIQNKCDSVEFRGCFPMAYSAGSVVQDNRKGALKYDYVLIYEKCSNGRAVHGRWKKLADLDGWSCSLPKKAR